MKVKIKITPPPFITEVECNPDEQDGYAEDVAMERFCDAVNDREYLDIRKDYKLCKVERI